MSKVSDQIAEAIANGPPPVAASGSGDALIGVPKTYVPPGMEVTGNDAAGRPIYQPAGISHYIGRTFTPYYEGDDWQPASLPPEKIAAIQTAMAQAGALKDSYRKGFWDDASRGAYRDLLSFANGAGVDAETALARYAQSKATTSTEAAKHFPLRIPDYATVRQAVKKIGKDVLGRDLQTHELDYLSEQMNTFAHQQAEAEQHASVAAAEGTDTSVPTVDAESRFRELLDQRYAPEKAFDTQQADTAANQQMIGKSLSSLAQRIGGSGV